MVSSSRAVIAAKPEAEISKNAAIATDFGMAPLTAATIDRARSKAHRRKISTAA
jgi:hypothetical protein